MGPGEATALSCLGKLTPAMKVDRPLRDGQYEPAASTTAGRKGHDWFNIASLVVIAALVLSVAVSFITNEPISQAEADLIRREHAYCQAFGGASDEALERLGTTDCLLIADMARRADISE